MSHARLLLFSSIMLGALFSTPSFGVETVYLTVDSLVNEEVVQPGDTIDWAIELSVSTGDNAGLALISIDLIQNTLNPEKFVIPYADTCPTAMADFARPDGISSPGTGGYRGTQLGTDCYADLRCIGGAQNTFGVAGTDMGTDTTVDGGIGQSGTITIATGTFDAPDTRGVYIFRLEDAVANVLDSVETAPTPSPVSLASIVYNLNERSFYFVVCPGDVNGDGSVDMSDLAALLAAYGSCVGDPEYDPDADLDDSGCVDLTDLAAVTGNFNTVCDE